MFLFLLYSHIYYCRALSIHNTILIFLKIHYLEEMSIAKLFDHRDKKILKISIMQKKIRNVANVQNLWGQIL